MLTRRSLLKALAFLPFCKVPVAQAVEPPIEEVMVPVAFDKEVYAEYVKSYRRYLALLGFSSEEINQVTGVNDGSRIKIQG